MNYRVRLGIAAFFYYSGLIKLIRWWTQYSGRRLIILMHHGAAGKNLRRQMLYLRRRYRILPLEAALEELHKPGSERMHRRDRRTLMSLTFDDGYDDNYTHAFPLVCELKIPITIFLIPGHMESSNIFWWADHLVRLAQVDRVSFDGHTYYLDRQEERKALIKIFDDHVSNATSVAEREKLFNAICEILAVPASATANVKPAPLLTWTQVREMQQSGLVSFGAHTMHHPDLGILSNPIEVQHEVRDCRTFLEQQLGHSVNTFAYPYGRIGDQGLSAVEQAGYKWAVTTVYGFNTPQSNPHLLYRIEVDSDLSLLMVAAYAAGLGPFLSRVIRIARFLIRPLHRTGLGPRQRIGLKIERKGFV